MYKIAAMGDRDSIYGFASLGIHIFPEDRMESPAATLHNLATQDFAVIYITDSLASRLKDDIEKYKDRPLPVIVPIPGVAGNTGLGMRAIARAVEKAVGSDILADA
jgi:V/A-type H+-transporting ATPase subunit F